MYTCFMLGNVVEDIAIRSTLYRSRNCWEAILLILIPSILHYNNSMYYITVLNDL